METRDVVDEKDRKPKITKGKKGEERERERDKRMGTGTSPPRSS
jgi:hypothetical protein